MPIVNRNGEVLRENEVKIFIKMMKESLESHAAEAEHNIDGYLIGTQKDVGRNIVSNYRKAISGIDMAFEALAKGKKKVFAEDVFQNAFANVYKQSIKDSSEYSRDDIQSALQALVLVTGDDTQAKYYEKNYQRAENDDKTIISMAEEFKLATEPIPGISELTDYNPASDRTVSLAVARMGNSSTYAELKDKMNRPDKTELTDADRALFGFYSASEAARVFSSEIMHKNKVGFEDMYNAFTSLNSILRTGDEKGGTMRGGQVFAGQITGVGSAKCPSVMYNTMSILADHMNKIKQTQSRALQRTQAVQLAAFAYQMTLSEHLFGDANGRTCRLLSDVILQSFGLPPHTPSKDELSLCHTMDGSPLDFSKGTEVFLRGVQLSDEVVKEQKLAERAKANPEELRKQEEAGRIADQMYEERYARSQYHVDRINDSVTKQYLDFRKQVKQAKSSFKNSKEYGQFEIMVDAYVSLVKVINKAKNAGQTQINLNDLNPNAKTISLGILKNDVPENGVVDFTDAGRLMAEFAGSLSRVAEQYEQYKMKDHTLDPKKEPDKKLLNKDDIKKLNLVRFAMDKKPLPKDLYKEASVSKQNDAVSV